MTDFFNTIDPKPLLTKGRNRPILLKKSAIVSTIEKYALEIEIFTLSRGFRRLRFRVAARKKVFSAVSTRQSGRTDFFNSIGRLQPAVKSVARGHLVRF